MPFLESVQPEVHQTAEKQNYDCWFVISNEPENIISFKCKTILPLEPWFPVLVLH